VELAPGTILLGKYQIEGLIGTGGMGHVVRASHLYLHQPVAIKLLLPEMAESASTVQRFLREAQATVKLRNEHIARVMDVGTTESGIPFMVMEFLDGNDLNQILRHHGPQAPAIVVDLMLQACEGIAEAHALGITHRDIKPSNFFITRRPDGSMLLKILDFGISKTSIGYSELTGIETVLGTPAYMAPEQMKSGHDADARSDLWSIGVVMYQLVSGRPPFAGDSYAELVLKVGLEPPAPMPVPLPAGLNDIITRCLEKDPAQRHQNVGELARLLAPYATDPISAAQSATRAARILQQRSSMQGLQGLPVTVGGGLTAPIPISPAQLTPRSWPPSQSTSVSRGVGQVTNRARASRGWVIASVAGLCVLAAGGGYAISQLSRSDRGEPHVLAPTPATQPAAATPSTATPAAATPTVANSADSKPADSKPADSKPADSKPADSKPADSKPADIKPADIKPTDTKSADTKPVDSQPATPAVTKSADTKSADTKPADTKPTPAGTKSADTRSTAHAVAKPTDAKPATSAVAKSADTKAATSSGTGADTKPARSTDSKAGDTKSSKSRSKSKPSDDLFDNRR
jgi:serine/threonine-protein kinase